ncbi:HAD family hydrolase [Enterococcus sp. AZ072]|uniref:HAD family hydrolase n=1 Tax=unclassified Enterococcus TaxID=2608891 RepID=UPI003D28403F
MKCVIFDMDGTLINSESIYYSVWSELVEQENYALSKKFYKNILGCPTDQIQELFLNYFGSAFPFEKLFASFMEKRNELIQTGSFDLTAGVREFLDHCHSSNITCGVATSSHKEEALCLLEKMGIYNDFSFFSFGDEVTQGKPSPEIFELAVHRSGTTKEQTIVFEDSKNGLLAAHYANLPVFLVNDFISLEPNHEKLSTYSFKNFLQVMENLERLNIPADSIQY